MLDEKAKAELANRLKRIEGQVGGIRRMVDGDKYCVDILLQISAVRAALGQVGKIVLSRHVETCVVDAIRGDDSLQTREKIKELMEVFVRYGNLRKE